MNIRYLRLQAETSAAHARRAVTLAAHARSHATGDADGTARMAIDLEQHAHAYRAVVANYADMLADVWVRLTRGDIN